ncbi:MAG: rod shape-determining protein MreC [Polyangiales bacterium]
MSTPLKQARDAAVVLALLAIPFFVLRANIREERKLNALDRGVLRGTSWLQVVGAQLGRGLSRVAGSYVYLVDVKAENERLQHETAVLRDRVRELEALEVDNRRLKRLLGLREQLSAEGVTAMVIAKDATDFRVMRVVLDRPSSDVVPGWVVLNDEGVVGVVLRVTESQVEVRLAVDPEQAIDVVDQRSGARGLARGTADSDRYACKVEWMKRSDEVAVGDLLVTSGVGARFAKGLAVAKVTKIHDRGFGEFQEVEAEPVVSFSRLEEVLLVPPTATGLGAAGAVKKEPGR